MDILEWISKQYTWEITLRLLLSMFAGMCIGIDRGVKRRGAGVKTHSLVCIGAALVMLTGEYIYHTYEGTFDISRLGAQVISGVGFLGVGTIIVTGRNQVRGLTTAAGLWVCACIGLAYGIGFYDGATIMFLLCIFILKVMTKVDIYVYKHSKILDVYIGVDSADHMSKFMEELKKLDLKIIYFEISKSKFQGEDTGTSALLTIEMQKAMREQVLAKINAIEGIMFVEEL